MCTVLRSCVNGAVKNVRDVANNTTDATRMLRKVEGDEQHDEKVVTSLRTLVGLDGLWEADRTFTRTTASALRMQAPQPRAASFVGTCGLYGEKKTYIICQ
jgi:hypothetical protein